MPPVDLQKQIEALESENRLLHAEIKRLREALGLPLEDTVPEIAIVGSSISKYSFATDLVSASA